MVPLCAIGRKPAWVWFGAQRSHVWALVWRSFIALGFIAHTRIGNCPIRSLSDGGTHMFSPLDSYKGAGLGDERG